MLDVPVIRQLPSMSSTLASERRTGIFPTIGGKGFALAVLFSMNLLNYVDRYTFFAVGPQIQSDLHIGDARLGWLYSSFMIVYTMVSPFVGWLGDRYHRRGLLCFGVGLWSLATVGTAFAHNFHEMFFWRPLLGVGEASYGVIAPTLLADLFPAKDRGRVMGLYYLALPLGRALGYGIGGWVVAHHGWPAAFWVVGLPGFVAAIAALLIHDPGRGARTGHVPARPTGPGARVPRPAPDPDVRPQHGRVGRGDLRDRWLRGLGLDVLPAGPGHEAGASRSLDRRPDRAARGCSESRSGPGQPTFCCGTPDARTC